MKAAASEVTTIDQYIQGFPEEVQAKLSELRSTIRMLAPQATERTPRRRSVGRVENSYARRFVVALVATMLVVPSSLVAQAEQPASEPVKEGSLIMAILVVEGVAFGSGTAARHEKGARVVGVIDGVSGAAVLAIAVSTSRATGRPQFSVPYGLGLLGLSYYNLSHASSSRGDRRFWVNVIGVNATALVSALTAYAFRENRVSPAVRIGVVPGGVHARLAF